jgi:nucleotide-binding universal stress UspA family protein
MQPIVVAIDFSNTSIHCIEYAIPIANKVKSDIILVWVDKLTAQESLYPDTSNQNRNEAKKRFDDLVKQYGKKMGKGLKIEYKLRKGKVYHEVDTLAKNVCALMIIAGAHGISGFEEFWIGSNAFKMVTYASVPVITVRNDFKISKDIKNILVPIDNSAETLQKMPFVAQLAQFFKSQVHVVATHSSHLKSIQRISEKYARQAIQYLEDNQVRFVQDSIVSNDITKAVISYAAQINADLISIMTEQETPMNILMGPHTQQLINQSPIPVLSVHSHNHISQ